MSLIAKCLTNNTPAQTMEIDMSIANDILKVLKDKCIFSENEALNNKQLFDYCKSANSEIDISKNLSALFAQGKIQRIKPDFGSYKYWLPQDGAAKIIEQTTDESEWRATKQKFFKDNSDPALATKSIAITPVKETLKPCIDDLAKADSVDEKLGEIHMDRDPTKPFIDFAKAYVQEVQEKLASDASHFKAAITTDGTLILFGLTQQNLELNVEQTKILVKFCSVIAL